LAFLAAAACLFFYPLGGEENRTISDRLAERRKKFAAS